MHPISVQVATSAPGGGGQEDATERSYQGGASHKIDSSARPLIKQMPS